MSETRTLDAVVAEKVMGWTRVGASNLSDVWDGPNNPYPIYGFRPSVDMTDAWRVVEHLRARGYDFALRIVAVWTADFEDSALEAWSADAESAPLAICRAALAARGVELPV